MGKDAGTCFFCEKRRAEESSNYYISLRKEIPDDNITKKSNKNIITKIVEVPRCPRCKSIHDIGFKTTVLAGIVIGALWFWYVLFVNNELFASILAFLESGYDPDACLRSGACPPTIIDILLIGLILGLVTEAYIVDKCVSLATRPIDYANNYILVKVAKDVGFE